MGKIKLDLNSMKIISLFETITRASVRDCFEDEDRMILIVNEGEIGKAIGKGSVNVRKIENALKKKVRIIEYNADMQKFVRNVVFPLRLEEVSIEGNVMMISAADHKTRGLLIGRSAQNLRSYERVIKRYFPIDELKVRS
ncbi:NusA-like transcription termination signal-binding factor [Nanoarchaeota archaeon]